MSKGKLSSAILLAAVIVAASSFAFGQGRYANVYSKRQVSDIIRKLETSSNLFRRDFDRYLDRSSLNGTSDEDRLNDIVARYESSLNRLRGDYDNSDRWWQSRDNVEEVMQNARPVNGMMNTLPFARNLERQWNRMRRDLNQLAQTFDLPGLASGGGGGGDGRWGDGRGSGRPPAWAQGTFYGRNPQTGGSIMLTVDGGGSVRISFDGGAPVYASMNGTTMTNGPYVSRVSRINDGIRTTDVTNGSYIDYFRNSGEGGGVGLPAQQGNVPSWALGTFYGRNPQTGGTIMLTVQSDGAVAISFDGGQPIYASMNRTTLTNGQYVSRVTRINNGIRTTDVTNGSYIDYYRQ